VSTLDGQNVFGSGPAAFRTGSWQRAAVRRSFPGLDGELVLDLGLRSREIFQTGRLQSATAEALADQIGLIEGAIDGRCHSLADNHGRAYWPVLVEEFQPSTPVTCGRGFWCEYTVRYRQLP
jgi:hypothetical protein